MKSGSNFNTDDFFSLDVTQKDRHNSSNYRTASIHTPKNHSTKSNQFEENKVDMQMMKSKSSAVLIPRKTPQ